jgi:hypothetical protein
MPRRHATTARSDGDHDGVDASRWAPNGAQEQVMETLLPVELIIAEAKRWEIADDIALQVLPTGRVNLMWRSARASEFVEHLLGLQAAGRFGGR